MIAKWSALLLCLSVSSSFADETLHSLRAEIGSARCVQDSQCRTVAIGAQSCGGPERYLPWSVAEGQGEKIALLARKYSQQRVLDIKKSGELSACQFVADPGAVCRQKQCVLQSAGVMN
ncbi:hypothetical protein [Iodobacter fluviatilis]|uniref:DUF4189 domain-containing protein n=1 Tax=Iodobacter fluviatilis TaxID=537 RepID=A0A377Q1W0_9NEIS|nr:hypothetical protein [Iodobacter fluviatilis]TCU90229.1 hypothetical protein EV682_101251 [Iodobacter fluviatilis]STQ89256.1 Uncharacterised protein [Iodobacter fluviatilis]